MKKLGSGRETKKKKKGAMAGMCEGSRYSRFLNVLRRYYTGASPIFRGLGGNPPLGVELFLRL